MVAVVRYSSSNSQFMNVLLTMKWNLWWWTSDENTFRFLTYPTTILSTLTFIQPSQLISNVAVELHLTAILQITGVVVYLTMCNVMGFTANNWFADWRRFRPTPISSTLPRFSSNQFKSNITLVGC